MLDGEDEDAMNQKYLITAIEDKIALVTINRPDKGNALSPEVLTEIGDIFTDLNQREDVHVIVLTGSSKIFSGGFDLESVQSLRRESNEAFTALFHRAYRSIMFCAQPVIAAIEGAAIAGGFDLTLMCDIRYAAENSKFSQREVLLSLVPMFDPLWRVIGMGPAKEIALTGRIFDAEEALRLGYVTKLFTPGTVLSSVMEIARTMASYDRMCMMEIKRFAHNAMNNSVDGAMKMHEWLFRTYVGSDDNRERIKKLLESLKKK